MKHKVPYKIISRLKTNAPTHETGGWGRRHGDFSDDGESSGYKSVCVYVQNGLEEYFEQFKEIAKGIFKIQQGNNRKYPLIVFGFGDTDYLQHERKYFEFGYINDIYNINIVAETIARISGKKLANPAIIPELYPRTDIRSLYQGKTKIDKDDLLVIIGKENQVYLDETLRGKIRRSFIKQILSVDISTDHVSFMTREKTFEYKSLINE